MSDHWPIWFVSIVLVFAAVIDGYKLRVPNWLTFPFVISGWIYGGIVGGWTGLAWSLGGTAVGLGLLLPAYAIGGMGAGDVKLLAGVGAWILPSDTFYAFCVSAVIGGVIALSMIAIGHGWRRHKDLFLTIINEIVVVREPTALATLAAQRKSSMMLLPYGIPIALGTIAYFIWAGMLV